MVNNFKTGASSSAHNLSDSALIARFMSSEKQDVFQKLVERHQSSIRQFLRRLTAGDRAMADDLAQDVFMRAYLNLPSFRGESKFTTWLHKIAYHCFLRNQRTNRIYNNAEEVDGLAEQIEERDLSSEIALEQIMKHLSEEERVVFTLTYAAGMSQSEVSAVVGCPLGTVKSHLNRGQKKLRLLIVKNEEAELI